MSEVVSQIDIEQFVRADNIRMFIARLDKDIRVSLESGLLPEDAATTLRFIASELEEKKG